MAGQTQDLPEQPSETSARDRLDSWKEIAAYLHCSERTVRRWEDEGLPIHRHPHKKKAGIYAYKAEIDSWWNNGRVRLEELERSPTSQRPYRSLWLAITLVTAAVTVGVVGRFAYRVRGAATPHQIESLAVLPLKNLSGDPAQDYFADGMTEQLTTDLGQISALRVISRTSAMRYKGPDKSLPDVLALQDEVAQAIANEIRIKLTPQERSLLGRARPVNAGAHEADLRGFYVLHGMTTEVAETSKVQAIEKAIGYFQRAVTLDANDALGYSGLADAYSSLSTHYRAPLEVMPKAKAAAVKAIELDDTLAEAHVSLGYVALTFDWDWVRAEHEFRRALELNPSLPRAHAFYAEYLLFRLRRIDDAMQELQRAYALDPLLPIAHGDLAWLSFLARRYEESIATAQRVGHDDHIEALSYAELGQRDLALAAADRAASSSKNPVILAQTAAAYALAGSSDKARAMLPGIEGQARNRYVCGFNVAGVYAALSDKEQAVAWLEKAYLARSD